MSKAKRRTQARNRAANVRRSLITHAELNPVRSRRHDWADGEKVQYDSLRWQGRTLYDTLRTKYDWGHVQALAAATERASGVSAA